MLVAAALAPELISFVVALIALQIASALILYDAAFAALVQSYGSQGRSRITQLTLIAGFASTLFWPLTTWLDGVMDWRQVFLVFAALNFALCLPLHLILKIAPPKPETEPAPADPGEKPHVQHAPVPKHLQRRVLVLVTAGFALSGFMLSAVLAQMVPVLTALGIGSVSLWIAALFGPAQVLVRLVSMMFGVRRHPLFMTLIASSMLPLAVMILTLSAPMTAGAVAFSILLGFGSGLKSIVQGALPLALFGSASYGTRLGQIALPRQVLAAVAPFAFAFMVDTAGQTTAMVVLVVIAGFGLAAFVEVARLQKRLE
jgi:MFS family permease